MRKKSVRRGLASLLSLIWAGRKTIRAVGKGVEEILVNLVKVKLPGKTQKTG